MRYGVRDHILKLMAAKSAPDVREPVTVDVIGDRFYKDSKDVKISEI